MRVIRQHQRRVQSPGEKRQGPALRLAQGSGAGVVSGRRAGKARRRLPPPGRLPSCGVLEVQIHAPKVGLPPGGERQLRPGGRQGPGPSQDRTLLQAAGDQIRPVGVDKRRDIHRAPLQERPSGNASDFAVLFPGPGQGLGKFQQHRHGNPLVGVVPAAV